MAGCMDAAQLTQLQGFIDLCSRQPNILHTPQLRFFKNYLERFVYYIYTFYLF